MKIPIPDDWNGVDRCRFAVCWPDSSKWKAILFGLISSPRQGRFWDEETGRIVDTQAAFNPFYLENFNLPEVLMACNDTGIADALNSIAIALQNNKINGGGGGGGCGPGTTGVPDVYCYSTSNAQVQAIITIGEGESFPVYGSGPIAVLPESGIPDGYPSENSYDADKCRKANKMVDDWITTVKNISVASGVEAAISAPVLLACIVGIITVPVAAIPVILWLMVVTVGISVAANLLGTYMSEHHDELVCILYQHETVEAILGAISDWLEVALSAISVEGALASALKRIAMLLLSADTLNKLFTDAAKDQYPDADCGNCDDCLDMFIPPEGGSYGPPTEIDRSVGLYEGIGRQNGPGTRYDFQVNINNNADYPNLPCGPMVSITSISITGGSFVTNDWADRRCIVYDDSWGTVYDDEVLPSSPVIGSAVVVVSGESCTVKVEWENI